MQYNTIKYNTPQHNRAHTMALHYIAWHYMAIRYIPFHEMDDISTPLHCITIHYIRLHGSTLHCVTLLYITLQLQYVHGTHLIARHYVVPHALHTLHAANTNISYLAHITYVTYLFVHVEHTHIQTCMCMHTDIQTYMHARTTSIHTYNPTYAHFCIPACLRTYTHRSILNMPKIQTMKHTEHTSTHHTWQAQNTLHTLHAGSSLHSLCTKFARTHMYMQTNRHTYHYTTLHHTALHYVTLQNVTLQHSTIHWIAWHCMALHHVIIQYSTAQHITNSTLRYVKLRYVTVGRKKNIPLSLSNFMTIFDIASNYIAAHCAACHRITVLHYITYHYATLQTSRYFSIAHGNTVNMFAWENSFGILFANQKSYHTTPKHAYISYMDACEPSNFPRQLAVRMWYGKRKSCFAAHTYSRTKTFVLTWLVGLVRVLMASENEKQKTQNSPEMIKWFHLDNEIERASPHQASFGAEVLWRWWLLCFGWHWAGYLKSNMYWKFNRKRFWPQHSLSMVPCL